MNLLRVVKFVPAAALFALLAACGSGTGGLPKRINPPVASVQQLRVLPDGRWELELRVQNFSTVPMTFGTLEAQMQVQDINAGAVYTAVNLEIPGQNADVVNVTLSPATAARTLVQGDAARAGFSYKLTGSFQITEPDKRFTFERSSRLDPVPGIPNTFR
jgi:hypothetical protein